MIFGNPSGLPDNQHDRKALRRPSTCNEAIDPITCFPLGRPLGRPSKSSGGVEQHRSDEHTIRQVNGQTPYRTSRARPLSAAPRSPECGTGWLDSRPNQPRDLAAFVHAMAQKRTVDWTCSRRTAGSLCRHDIQQRGQSAGAAGKDGPAADVRVRPGGARAPSRTRCHGM
jgi:hypothetical protein